MWFWNPWTLMKEESSIPHCRMTDSLQHSPKAKNLTETLLLHWNNVEKPGVILHRVLFLIRIKWGSLRETFFTCEKFPCGLCPHPSKTRLGQFFSWGSASHSARGSPPWPVLPSALLFDNNPRKNEVFANEGPGKSFPWQGSGQRPEKRGYIWKENIC